MASGEDALVALRSIDASLKELLAIAKATAPKPVAPDRDLDGQYGNPELKFMPRDWTGISYKGSRFSECPADLLEMIAETFDYFAQQAEANHEQTGSGKPVAPYKRQDAARARGWARRIRNGWVGTTKPEPTEADGGFGSDDSDPELGF
jgi:hypothetical protein